MLARHQGETQGLLHFLVNFHLLTSLKMETWYNFGIEIEMIATPHKTRDFRDYQNESAELVFLQYYISYYKRLARAMTRRGLEAEARGPDSNQARPGLRGWFVTWDSSVKNEDGSKPKPPHGESIPAF